jgi:DNA polymerase-3 subunit alpha (Gram-positive type)
MSIALPFSADDFATHEMVILDLETTGLDPMTGDCITEIAAVKTHGKKVIAKYEQLVNPGRPISAEAEKITGITNAHVMMFGKPLVKAIPEFVSFMGGATLVGHNLKGFDINFIQKHASDLGMPQLTNQLVDTLEIARASLSLGRYRLDVLAEYFGIEQPHAHRAMIDVQTTMEVLWKLLELRGIK